MNIKEAKESIRNTVEAYLSRNEFGEYIIPIEKQRPVFLMGPPGIGKTAIVEQVAGELGVGLLTYSMTHHTRQSALGLPFISHKNYGGREYDISEYTMSEIIASIYEVMEVTGLEQGILFLDEINCVSETLSPIMLQFLQYKVFGRHTVPEGWIVVTAGNPPEFNNSVREFDIATWDRVKRIDIEPEIGIWKEYALSKGVHPAILTYLESKNSSFYSIESTVDGKKFVTARGWEDLSQIMRIYEARGIEIDYKLVIQYVQSDDIAGEFSIYYKLFNRYKGSYDTEKILSGKVDKNITDKAGTSKFDERIALIGLLLDALREESRILMLRKDTAALYGEKIKQVSGYEKLEEIIASLEKEIKANKVSKSYTEDKLFTLKRTFELLSTVCEEIKINSGVEAKIKLQESLETLESTLKEEVHREKERFENMFDFLGKTFGKDKEILIAVTEITKSRHIVKFITTYGCDSYFKYSREFMTGVRNNEIDREIGELGV